jgi:hypothetical protein
LDSINGAQPSAPEGQAEWSVGRVLELVQTFAQVSCLQRCVTLVTTLQRRLSNTLYLYVPALCFCMGHGAARCSDIVVGQTCSCLLSQ